MKTRSATPFPGPGCLMLTALSLLSALCSAPAADPVTDPTSPPLAAVHAALVDSRASDAAVALMTKLTGDYGKHSWSGQYGTDDVAHLRAVCGRTPAILGADFMDYSPSRVAFSGRQPHLVESLIKLARSGQVITMSWHWNAPTNLLDSHEQPWWRGFYTKASTFDVAAALSNTDSAEYALILRDIDAIALQLQKFSDANIPILWRPLHEAEGGWFWWGAKGPQPFKALWRLLYTRITEYHHLHNLIWVLTSENPDWYPGNDVVDIIGVDAYPKDPKTTLLPGWNTLKGRFNGVKLVALTEFGGVPDIERMHAAGVWWSYFVSWNGTLKSVPAATITRAYRSPSVVTRDELNLGNQPTHGPN